jgi:hypothetical protein
VVSSATKIDSWWSSISFRGVYNLLTRHWSYLFFEDIISYRGLLKLDAVDAVDALHPHLLKLDAVHPVPTKTGCSASSTY